MNIVVLRITGGGPLGRIRLGLLEEYKEKYYSRFSTNKLQS